MPAGRTHDRITWFLAPWLLGLALWAGLGWGEALPLSACFLFAGLMFSGDLDLPSVQSRRWGLLRWIWRPYRLIPHRSALSHGLVLGPLFRVLYLIAWLGAGLWALGRIEPGLAADALGGIRKLPYDAMFWGAAGLFLGGASHTLADWGVSLFKRWRRQGSKRARARQAR